MPAAPRAAAVPAGGASSGSAGRPAALAVVAPVQAAAVTGAPGAVPAGGTLGFRTGGAQDVENFRENIKHGYLPLPTDVTFEGIVKDYYFDTSNPGHPPCTELFCPQYSLGVAPDPLLESANSTDYFLAVGLDSAQASSAPQHSTPLAAAGSPFDAYYYDQATGEQRNLTEAEQKMAKLDVAKLVLQGIVDQLTPGDSLSVVLFSGGACVALPLEQLQGVDLKELKRQMGRDIETVGSTDLQAGIDAAAAQLEECQRCKEANKTTTEQRIIIITDAQPNEGETTPEALLARLKALAYDSIHTTLIGVGLDFNTELAEAISKVKGALYFSVHSPGEFQQRLVQDFDFAVTPLVFDLALSVDPGSLAADGGDGWRILHVYGSPNPNDTALSSDGTVMRIDTLFPSPKTEQGIKGGVVLLRMAPPQGGSRPLQLAVGYTDREGRQYSTKRTVAFPQQAASAAAGGGSFFESSGVEKAVLLARYTDILHDWLLDEWQAVQDKQGNDTPISIIPGPLCGPFPRLYCPIPVESYDLRPVKGGCVLASGWLPPGGCVLPPPVVVLTPLLGRWERQSQKLQVSPEAKSAFEAFLPYFQGEAGKLNDPTLNQETDIMKLLISA
ncbi:hypothetical protein ABPG75_013556 [Micractinium tetrahymenae]